MKISRLIILGVVLLGVSSAFAQKNKYLDDQIKYVWNEYLSEYNFSNDYDITYDNLNNSATDSYGVELDSSLSYQIVAVCDKDCGDIDLFLYDERGNLVDDDETDDDFPIVGVSPRISQEYTLKVKMYNCEIEPCRFAIAVFER